MRHFTCLLAASLMMLAGCGDKKPATPPPGTDTDTPAVNIDLDIDTGDDEPGDGDVDVDADVEGGDDTPAAGPPADDQAQAPAAAGEEGWGNLTITFKSDKAVEQPNADGVAAANCGVPNVKLEEVVIDPDSLALANVVVWLNEDDPMVHADLEALKQQKPQIDNVQCRFEPHVVSMWTEQTLTIGNKDPIGHNSKVDAFDNPSINPVIPPGGTVDAEFPNPEATPMPVSCNIHRWMKGYIVVKPHPYVGVSGKDGVLKIAKLPAGTYNFRAWHETGYVQDVKVDGKDTDWSKGRFDLEIPSAGEVNMTVVVPADSLQ